jgi:hypothetical protein
MPDRTLLAHETFEGASAGRFLQDVTIDEKQVPTIVEMFDEMELPDFFEKTLSGLIHSFPKGQRHRHAYLNARSTVPSPPPPKVRINIPASHRLGIS